MGIPRNYRYIDSNIIYNYKKCETKTIKNIGLIQNLNINLEINICFNLLIKYII